MKKRLTSIILMTIMCITLLSGCSDDNKEVKSTKISNNTVENNDEDKNIYNGILYEVDNGIVVKEDEENYSFLAEVSTEQIGESDEYNNIEKRELICKNGNEEKRFIASYDSETKLYSMGNTSYIKFDLGRYGDYESYEIKYYDYSKEIFSFKLKNIKSMNLIEFEDYIGEKGIKYTKSQIKDKKNKLEVEICDDIYKEAFKDEYGEETEFYHLKYKIKNVSSVSIDSNLYTYVFHNGYEIQFDCEEKFNNGIDSGAYNVSLNLNPDEEIVLDLTFNCSKESTFVEKPTFLSGEKATVCLSYYEKSEGDDSLENMFYETKVK